MAKALVFQYPGDPALPATVLTGAEFLAAMPSREVNVYADGQCIHHSDLGDDIYCDVCNAEVAPDAQCVLVQRSNLYCWPCANQYVLPYSTEVAR